MFGAGTHVTQYIFFEAQKPVPIAYKGISLDCGYRVDLLVEDLVIVELKTVEQILREMGSNLYP